MLLALLAAYLTKRPPWVQACVFGLCAGLFVATAANANERDPLIGSVLLQVVTVAVVAGTAFFVALRSRLRRGPTDGGPPAWVHCAYAGVWLLAIGAAVWALLGDGGLKVAVLAIVPIVLLAPPALLGIRALAHRASRTGASAAAEPRA
ncbi:hypothetical protein E4P40_00940 [Blastococcus sp. CT_GayMR20]|uniref:hypothetical protein n=1 Tax=Blastococcus sp. CT_GayMR20 TaxID=2559609 RepID=UPI0010735D1B|nr:hypothetical protein [Blastococcus sp. CT_GayMR20]TFV92982.1 hypothetical protein E4P40_00940 [Blastococcus sp. CT_GayMR20]